MFLNFYSSSSHSQLFDLLKKTHHSKSNRFLSNLENNLCNMFPSIHGSNDGCMSSSYRSLDGHETANSPLNENRTTKPRRRVSFESLVKLCNIKIRINYTKKEFKRTWYNSEEERQMKVQAITDTNLMESGVLDESSARGLEGRTKEGNRQKRTMRMDAYDAVFKEVEFQVKTKEFFNEELIADAYLACSEACAMMAHKKAKEDEFEAMNIHRTSS